MVLKGQECLLTRDLIVTSTLRFGGCRIYYKMKYLYDIYSHDCLHFDVCFDKSWYRKLSFSYRNNDIIAVHLS